MGHVGGSEEDGVVGGEGRLSMGAGPGAQYGMCLLGTRDKAAGKTVFKVRWGEAGGVDGRVGTSMGLAIMVVAMTGIGYLCWSRAKSKREMGDSKRAPSLGSQSYVEMGRGRGADEGSVR